ncbi:MAG: AAA family ATPase [Burkholderiales bacterium]|nr:AAA family ATPase [Burkholderiales bacterium]
MENFEELVVVERVLSQLERGCIFTARREGGDPVRVKFSGRDTQPLEGDWFIVKGLLTPFRDRFGRMVDQVESKRMKRAIGKGSLLKPWLERLPNIGDARAARLVEAFGHDLQAVLSDLSRVSEVAMVLEPSKPVLATKIAAQVYARVAAQAGADAVKAAEVGFLTYLEQLGIRESRAASQLWRLMAGADAVERLRRNPYVFAALLDWKLADRLGQRLVRDAEPTASIAGHPARLLGALGSVWRELLAEGDTAAAPARVEALLKARNVSAEAALSLADEKGLLRRAGELLRAPGAAWLEDQVVAAILRIEAGPPSFAVPTGDALAKLVYDAECCVGMHLTGEQSQAVAELLILPVAALQGGAGVGKTTVMKVLALAWETLGGDVVMGALAGKAALTLARGASTQERPRLAYTVARLIGMLERQRLHEEDSSRKRPASDVQFTSKTLLIVDEAGMLDTPGLHKLLSLLPAGARLLFAGDYGQLPPVGIGKFFHDLVAEGSRVATLTKVLRQASDSAIPVVAAQVRNGVPPALSAWKGEAIGVFLVPEADLVATQRQLRARHELLVVAAKKTTVAAINGAESTFRRAPGTPVRRLGPLATVAVGDPVVVTANRYQHGLFNGLLGVVQGVDDAEVLVLWDGESLPRSLPAEAEGEVELAFAITCHKAQGSSSEAVLIAVEDTPLVTRDWLYTAITRGKELVLLAAADGVVAGAVSRRTQRITGLRIPARRRIDAEEAAQWAPRGWP